MLNLVLYECINYFDTEEKTPYTTESKDHEYPHTQNY